MEPLNRSANHLDFVIVCSGGLTTYMYEVNDYNSTNLFIICENRDVCRASRNLTTESVKLTTNHVHTD